MTTENKACFIEVIHSNVDFYMRMPRQARVSCRFYDPIEVPCDFYFYVISLLHAIVADSNVQCSQGKPA